MKTTIGVTGTTASLILLKPQRRRGALFAAAVGVGLISALGACGGGGGGGGSSTPSSQSLADQVDPVTGLPIAAAAVATPWPGGTWTAPAATYGAAIDARRFVTMSDGVQIAVDVAYPTNADGSRAVGPFPVIMTQSPYNPSAADGNYYVQRGYIYVTMRVRGTSGSGGTFDFFASDGKDGAEVVRWLGIPANVPNSNGVVGIHGGSWAGLNQLFAAAKLGPNTPLKAMVVVCAGSEFYRETYFNAGIATQTMNFPGGFAGLGGPAATPLVNEIYAYKVGGDTAYYRDFWKARSSVEVVQQVAAANVPTLLWSSNGDIYAQSSLNLFTYLQNAYSGQPIYGPMNRSITPTSRYQINISQGGHCANSGQEVQLQWFEQWLKGVDTGVINTKMPIHVNEVLANRWINTSHYPVVPTYTKYYLDTAGALSPSVPGGAGLETLAWAQPAAASTTQYESPVFTNGGTLAGPISASVYASSTSDNLELIATVQAVAANGTVTALTQGAVLGSLSNNDPVRSWSDSNGTPVLPYGTYDLDRFTPAGTIKKYDFLISPRFVQLQPGSTLRVVFTTQHPSNNCGGSLGVNPCFTTLPQKLSLTGSQVTIYHGPTTASSINLPLLPASCWRYTRRRERPDAEPAAMGTYRSHGA
jgi:predicted acyl esterase